LEIVAQVAAKGVLQSGAIDDQCNVRVLCRRTLELSIMPMDDIAGGLKKGKYLNVFRKSGIGEQRKSPEDQS